MKGKTLKQVIGATLAAAGAISVVSVATAQGLEEIIVTAQKREQSLQETPVAVTAYDELRLENLGVDSLRDLSVATPSLQTYDFPTSANNMALFIRGLGNLDSQTLTTDNPVGIYIDGVYIARSTGTLIDFLDLEQVEVLRGPQGTLYGRNSSAGAVKFATKKPAAEQGAVVKASVGNFGLYKVGASLDMPLSDTFRTKISAMTMSEDGWVDNSGPNSTGGQDSEDFNAKEQEAFRLALSWDVTDYLTADYSYDYTTLDSTPPYFQSPFAPDKRLEDTFNAFIGGDFAYVLPESDMEHSGHNLTLTWDVTDNVTVKSITAYRELDDHVYQNWSDSLTLATDLQYSTESFSQEFQITGSTDRLTYVAGLYYFSEDGDKLETQYTNFDAGLDFVAGTADDILVSLDAFRLPLAALPYVPAAFGGPVGTNLGFTTFDTELKSSAVYGQMTYSVTDRVDVTLGLRYTEDEREASRSGTNLAFAPGSNDQDFSSTDWTGILSYAFAPDINGYAKVATGFRAGGSSERAPDFSQTFDQEEVISYELGLKSELFDNRLRVNTALFRTETDDAINTIGGTGAQAALQETFNFGEVKIDGVELDVLWAVGEATTVGLNYVYLDTELSDVIVPAQSVLRAPGTDVTDTTFIAQAPDHAYSLSLDHSFNVGGLPLDAHLDYSFRDEVYSSALGLPVDELGLLHGRLSLRQIDLFGGEASISLWGKNLTDEEEVIYNLAAAAVQYNEPRTYGLDLQIRF